jgi:DNA polymerase-1
VASPLLVVDTPSMLFRAFYALPSKIVGTDGKPVNALLGSANLILKEVEIHQPRAVVLCFGPDAASYRTELYPAYHAKREEEMPDELAPQFDQARDFFEAFGWTVATSDDLEADDLLGTYAEREAKAGGHALLLTGDRDMYQCAGDGVTVLYIRTGGKGAEEVGPEEVRERYGIGPELVPDFIALRGDPSDGLPGAKGIGEKTAKDILQRKGSLEHAILGAIREKPSVRRALIEQAAELRSFKSIATLVEVEMDPVPDAETDLEGGARAAEALGMRRLAERLRKPS